MHEATQSQRAMGQEKLQQAVQQRCVAGRRLAAAAVPASARGAAILCEHTARRHRRVIKHVTFSKTTPPPAAASKSVSTQHAERHPSLQQRASQQSYVIATRAVTVYVIARRKLNVG